MADPAQDLDHECHPLLDIVVARRADHPEHAERLIGPANFIYTDGDAVFVHGHRRMNASGQIEPPGVHLLCRHCSARADGVELAGLSLEPHAEQHVTLVASVPLSEEAWQPLAEGEIVVLRQGAVARRIAS